MGRAGSSGGGGGEMLRVDDYVWRWDRVRGVFGRRGTCAGAYDGRGGGR